MAKKLRLLIETCIEVSRRWRQKSYCSCVALSPTERRPQAALRRAFGRALDGHLATISTSNSWSASPVIEPDRPSRHVVSSLASSIAACRVSLIDRRTGVGGDIGTSIETSSTWTDTISPFSTSTCTQTGPGTRPAPALRPTSWSPEAQNIVRRWAAATPSRSAKWATGTTMRRRRRMLSMSPARDELVGGGAGGRPAGRGRSAPAEGPFRGWLMSRPQVPRMETCKGVSG